jgi:hypothetical protein
MTAVQATRTRPRVRPRGLQRVLVGYLSVLLAIACGTPAIAIGFVSANNCHSEGFTCLGYFVYGLLGWGLIAVLALPLWVRRFRFGLWFFLLAPALTIAPVWLGDGSLWAGTAFLGPGLAAWISEPAGPDPDTVNPPGPRPPTDVPWRHWAPRLGAALVLSLLVPVLGRAF